MPKTKVEVYNKDQLIYPFIESDHVTFSNGMKVSEMLDQSISMPKVIHEDSSFKVGVGDQDVSSAIVDSSVAEMTIKGKTYQNILPEPSTHVLTNNKEMFKVNEGLDSNVEIVDGVSKSAILKGNTLVNLVSSMNTVGTNGVFKDGYITLTQKSYEYLACYITFSYPLTEGKKYLLVMDVKENTLGETFRTTTNSCIGSGKTIVSNGSTGIVKHIMTITGGDNLGRITLRTNTGDFSGSITFKPMLIEYQQGMENWDIPFFEGMQSVKMPVLTTTGKNLFDGVLSQGWIGDTTGESNTSREGLHGSQYIKVNPSSVYTFKAESIPNGITANSRFYFYDKNKTYLDIYRDGVASGSAKLINIPSDAHYMRFRFYCPSQTVTPEQFASCTVQIEEGSTATSYEPYKTNILHTPEEVVLRSLPNGIKDTLNLNTGEYVQRIGEITFKNQTAWEVAGGYPNVYYYNINDIGNANIYVGSGVIPNLHCDKMVVTSYSGLLQSTSGVKISNRGKEGTHSIAVYNSNITNSVVDFKAWLTQNPFTVQYELATPIIKTVDLSTSGNWEKIVLDGSEDWRGETIKNGMRLAYILPRTQQLAGGGIFSDKLKSTTQGDEVGIRNSRNNGIYLQISDDGTTIKQWVTANAPLTVWYQTITTQDSTQVKQPIFFKDGHIIQSSGVDNSLIPTLDYQAKTSNSYVMDLMKISTRYTMKAKSASGTFTIDGTSYGAGTNGTFTTPSSMTNKFLVMSNNANTEVMIFEGDVTSKTIPYFKGIKSAFEGEDKIEVLLTGKNLWTATPYNRSLANYEVLNNGDIHIYNDNVTQHACQYFTYHAKPNTTYTISYESATIKKGHVRLIVRNGNNNGEVSGDYYTGKIDNSSQNGVTATFTTDSTVGKNGNVIAIGFYCHSSASGGQGDVTYHNVQIIESTQKSEYEPYKSNNTKIPLLSPLRSLPDGTCDELIIDRENNKAKIIQRVGELDFSNLQYNTWIVSDSTLSKTVRFTWLSSNISFYKVKDSSDGICDSIPYIRYNSSDTEHCRFDGSNPSAFMIWVDKSKLTSFDDKGLKKYLSTLSSTRVQYELATPVITEVDLEGFPYIYKDGHIFLNGEIVPVTEITYSINQCQQISASNEDIIRHEKELTYLQKLIAQYVQVDYESVLLSLKV